ncbi:hypothetical protein OSB04_028308 [Centaurea solstitialis]|uniref:UDP-glycosyltransferase n=1 Tax=Centaurea solstitialis TaxID=347529 RepID=A0AA38W0I0_9ASTR|nr:hypothetical protein OSB04_028308 [Centaurea solstitialis]
MQNKGSPATTTTTIMSTQPPSNNRRLVLFPLPFQGHINPMLQLAKILHAKGFKITIIHTQFNPPPNQSNYPHFTFLSISDGLSKDSNVNLNTSNYVINFMNKSCIDPFRSCLARLLEEEPVACLISDSLWHFTQSVADGLNLPRIVLWTSSMFCILVYAALPFVHENGNLKTTIQGMQLMTQKDILMIYSGGFEEGKLELISSMIKETNASSGVIYNTFKELEEPEFVAVSQDFHNPYPIGPFHNIAQMDEAEFANMAWGLASSKQRFLWVVRPGSVRGSEWLEALPKGLMDEVGERGCIVKWAPQQEVLAHPAIGGFWTHCGWNSTLESICEGVPMICSPCSYDQPINARYVAAVLRIGVMLENGMEVQEIEKAITRVMVDKEGDEMRERSKSLQEKVNLSLQKDGSATQALENLVDYILSF